MCALDFIAGACQLQGAEAWFLRDRVGAGQLEGLTECTLDRFTVLLMTSSHKATCCVLHKNSTFCDAREPNVGYPALLMWIHSDIELQLRTPSQPSQPSPHGGGGDSKGIHTQPECRSSTRLNSEPCVSTPHSTHSRVCSTWLLGSGTASLCLCWLIAGRGIRLVALSPLACSHSGDFVAGFSSERWVWLRLHAA